MTRVLAVAAFAIVSHFALLRPMLLARWRTPGSPELYLSSASSALLLLVSAVFVLVKRHGQGESTPA